MYFSPRRAGGALIGFVAATLVLGTMAGGLAVARNAPNDGDAPSQPAARQPADDGRPGYLQRPMFVDTRFTDQISQMREAARQRFIDAGKWLEEARSRRIERKGQVEIKKREIETIEAKLKLAKKTGADEEKAALEAERALEQDYLKYLKQLEELEEAAEKRWTSAKKYAAAEDDMHGLQLDLAAKRAQRDESLLAQSLSPDRTMLEQETRELVRRTLESMRKAASARRDLAGKEGIHIDHQLRVLKSWIALSPVR